MASTNKTTHYELSQYVGSDKPTYLTDYNNDMSAIDTGIYNAQTKADSAYTLADTANGNAGTAQTTANTAVTSAGTANTNIGTMANLETTEKSSLVGAINELFSVISDFNLTTFETYNNASSFTVSGNASFSWGELRIAKNTTDSLFKLYGSVQILVNSVGATTITFNSSLRPTEQYQIQNIGVWAWSAPNNPSYTILDSVGATIKTNGDIELGIYAPVTGDVRLQLLPCLYFNKSFGDVPTQN